MKPQPIPILISNEESNNFFYCVPIISIRLPLAAALDKTYQHSSVQHSKQTNKSAYIHDMLHTTPPRCPCPCLVHTNMINTQAAAMYWWTCDCACMKYQPAADCTVHRIYLQRNTVRTDSIDISVKQHWHSTKVFLFLQFISRARVIMNNIVKSSRSAVRTVG